MTNQQTEAEKLVSTIVESLNNRTVPELADWKLPADAKHLGVAVAYASLSSFKDHAWTNVVRPGWRFAFLTEYTKQDIVLGHVSARVVPKHSILVPGEVKLYTARQPDSHHFTISTTAASSVNTAFVLRAHPGCAYGQGVVFQLPNVSKEEKLVPAAELPEPPKCVHCRYHTAGNANDSRHMCWRVRQPVDLVTGQLRPTLCYDQRGYRGYDMSCGRQGRLFEAKPERAHKRLGTWLFERHGEEEYFRCSICRESRQVGQPGDCECERLAQGKGGR